MSDFVKSQDYSDKDALASGDPEKLILGTDFDVELDALAVAIATKYDSTDLASQAQAEAGLNNTTLMTPLRVAQTFAVNAGALLDIQGLTDPNADRIMFWDDSAGAVTWLTAGTGLSITSTTLAVDFPTISITSLSDYDANKWVDHTGVTITAGTGLSGGGTIAASRTIDLDITELTELTSVDPAADFLVIYDTSATAHKKVLVENMVGEELGDGKWKLSSDQSLSTQTNALFATTVYDSLSRGSYNTGTYTYTASVACRVQVYAHATATALNNGHSLTLEIQKNGTSVARDFVFNTADASNLEHTVQALVNISLAQSDTVKVQFASSTTTSVESDEKYTWLCITELA